MSELKTVEDILDFNTDDVFQLPVAIDRIHQSILMIKVLANEIRDLKKQLTTQKLLIEHEENVRTASKIKQPKPKLVFNNGDRVIRIKDFSRNSADKRLVGTVKKSNGRRTFVR